MLQHVDADFQRRLDEFNASQGGPARIELCWDVRRDRWCVFAVPQDYGRHPLAKNDHTVKMLRPFLDGSGRMGVFLFTWKGANGEFMPLDERLFDTLRYADSFADKDHFENTITKPEQKAELAASKGRRDIASAAREYYWNIPNATVGGSNKGNWRRAKYGGM